MGHMPAKVTQLGIHSHHQWPAGDVPLEYKAEQGTIRPPGEDLPSLQAYVVAEAAMKYLRCLLWPFEMTYSRLHHRMIYRRRKRRTRTPYSYFRLLL